MAGESRRARAVPANRNHAIELAGSLSQEDADDLRLGWGCGPDEAVLRALRLSGVDCWAIETGDGETAAMFGAAGDGNIWMITGKAFGRDIGIRLVRESGPYFDAMLEKYGRLYGFINAGNGKMIRWLEWSGFVIEALGNGYARYWRDKACAAR